MRWDKGTLRVFTRHPSYNFVRNKIKTGKKYIVARFGSLSNIGNPDYEINSIQSIENCMNKLTMKRLFWENGVSSPSYITVDDKNALTLYKRGSNEPIIYKNYNDFLESSGISFPLLAKKTYRSRGQGMIIITSAASFNNFMQEYIINNKKNINNPYYFEVYKNYTREYRIHVSELGGYFYTCRKVLKNDTPQEKRYFRNSKNCAWLLEENPSFNKPKTWEQIIEECQKARKALGLSITGIDLKVSKDGRFVILEANSACSLDGEVVSRKYEAELTNIVNKI